jgi:hypothetical protein
MPAVTPSKARIETAISAAQAMGICISEVRIERDGTLRILASMQNDAIASPDPGSGKVVSCDELFKKRVSG